ncbi:hypothetical protein ACFLSQ_06950 [Bacteroidota bacterium]
MKIKRLILLLAVVIFALAFYSCSENESTAPSDTTLKMSDYFPASIGSWWIYMNYELDSLGNRISEGVKDSTYNAAIVMINGKDAIMQISVTVYEDDTDYDTTYFNVDGSKLYAYEDVMFEEGVKAWTLYVDLAADEWQIMFYEEHTDTTMINPMTGDTISIKQDIVLDFTGMKDIDKDYSIKGQTISAKGIKWQISMEYYSKIGDEIESGSDESFIYMWVAKGIGMVHNIAEPVMGESEGNERELIDYYISQ